MLLQICHVNKLCRLILSQKKKKKSIYKLIINMTFIMLKFKYIISMTIKMTKLNYKIGYNLRLQLFLIPLTLLYILKI